MLGGGWEWLGCLLVYHLLFFLSRFFLFTCYLRSQGCMAIPQSRALGFFGLGNSSHHRFHVLHEVGRIGNLSRAMQHVYSRCFPAICPTSLPEMEQSPMFFSAVIHAVTENRGNTSTMMTWLIFSSCFFSFFSFFYIQH